MSTKLTQSSYEQLIKEDLAELDKYMPDSLERNHIELILKNSVNFYYPRNQSFENKMEEINDQYEGEWR